MKIFGIPDMYSGPSRKDRFLRSFRLRTRASEDSSQNEQPPTVNENAGASSSEESTSVAQSGLHEPGSSQSLFPPHIYDFPVEEAANDSDSDFEPPDLISSFLRSYTEPDSQSSEGSRTDSNSSADQEATVEEVTPLSVLIRQRRGLDPSQPGAQDSASFDFERRLDTVLYSASRLSYYMRRIQSLELSLQDQIASLADFKITAEQIEKCDVCCVCMENFVLDEGVKKLPCDHLFHEACIHPWLRKHRTCPICRKVAVEANKGCKFEFHRFLPYHPTRISPLLHYFNKP